MNNIYPTQKLFNLLNVGRVANTSGEFNTIRDRLANDGYFLTPTQQEYLNTRVNLFISTVGVLPDLWVDGGISFNINTPSATKFYNLGSSGSTGDGDLVNGNIGTRIINDTDFGGNVIDFVAGSSHYIQSGLTQSGMGVGYTTIAKIKKPASGANMRGWNFIGGSASMETVFIGNDPVTRTIQQGNGGIRIGRRSSGFPIVVSHIQNTYNGDNLNTGLKVLANGVQVDIANSNLSSPFTVSENNATGNIVFGSLSGASDFMTARVQNLILFKGLELTPAQLLILQTI